MRRVTNLVNNRVYVYVCRATHMQMKGIKEYAIKHAYFIEASYIYIGTCPMASDEERQRARLCASVASLDGIQVQ